MKHNETIFCWEKKLAFEEFLKIKPGTNPTKNGETCFKPN